MAANICDLRFLIPEKTIQTWREMLDVLAEMGSVPVSLLDVNSPEDSDEVEIFVSNRSSQHRFLEGLRFSGKNFCQHVMRTGLEFRIENAGSHPEWRDSMAVLAGYESYIGLPVRWPNQKNFATLCVLDRNDFKWGLSYLKLLNYFREKIEADLQVIFSQSQILQVEESFRHSEEIRRQMIESSPDCVKILDLQSQLLSISAKGCELLEIDSDLQVLNQNWIELWPEDQQCKVRDALEQAKRGHVGRFEGFCPTLKGAAKWWDVIITPIFGSDGVLLNLLSVSRDITNRKAIEEALERSQNDLKLALKASRMATWTWKPGHTTLDVSDSFFELFECDPRRQVYVGSVLQAIHPEDEWNVLQVMMQALRGDIHEFATEFRCRQRGRGYLWVAVRGEADFDDGGVCQVFRGSVVDVEKIKTAEIESRVAKETAERANQVKSQFLANMSHEIRTPMNSILGFSDLLLTGEVSPDEQFEYINRIHSNGTQLLALINDILDLSKFEAGQVSVEQIEFHIRDLMKEVSENLKPLAEKKNIEIQTDWTSEVPEKVSSDPLRVRQVLLNLIGNSIKFSEKGDVRVRVDFNKKSGQVLLDIEDSGIGISESDQKKLFRPFSQADSSIVRRFGGSGLGLVLSKKLAEALGGSLSLLRSEAGVGSCFRFEFASNLVPFRSPL